MLVKSIFIVYNIFVSINKCSIKGELQMASVKFINDNTIQVVVCMRL